MLDREVPSIQETTKNLKVCFDIALLDALATYGFFMTTQAPKGYAERHHTSVRLQENLSFLTLLLMK